MKKRSFTISNTAKEIGIGIETIRYYQRIGLITEPTKPNAGYRIYPQSTLDRLFFIKQAKHLGFSLAEISNLLLLDAGQCDEMKQLTENKLTLINAKIKNLTSISTALKALIHSCENNSSSLKCPIIQIFKNHI